MDIGNQDLLAALFATGGSITARHGKDGKSYRVIKFNVPQAGVGEFVVVDHWDESIIDSGSLGDIQKALDILGCDAL